MLGRDKKRCIACLAYVLGTGDCPICPASTRNCMYEWDRCPRVWKSLESMAGGPAVQPEQGIIVILQLK